MKIIQSNMDEVCYMLNVVCASTKRREFFEAVICELVSSGAMRQVVTQPTYDRKRVDH